MEEAPRTQIRATCPTDGQVDLRPSDMWLFVNEKETNEGTYEFLCPDCHEPVVKPADDKVVKLLGEAGIYPFTNEVTVDDFYQGGTDYTFDREVPPHILNGIGEESNEITNEQLHEFTEALSDDGAIETAFERELPYSSY